jgi:hypothetical protein
MNIALLVLGVYLFAMGLFVKPRGLRSWFLIKYPVILGGAFIALYTLNLMGYIVKM